MNSEKLTRILNGAKFRTKHGTHYYQVSEAATGKEINCCTKHGKPVTFVGFVDEATRGNILATATSILGKKAVVYLDVVYETILIEE